MGRKKEPTGFAMGLLILDWVLYPSQKWHPTIYWYHFTIVAYQPPRFQLSPSERLQPGGNFPLSTIKL